MIILHISSADFKFKLATLNSLSTTAVSNPLMSICTSHNPDLCRLATFQASSSYHSESSVPAYVLYSAAVPRPSHACTVCSLCPGSHICSVAPHIQSSLVWVSLLSRPHDSTPCCTPHAPYAVPVASLHPRGPSVPGPNSPHAPAQSLIYVASPPLPPAVSCATAHSSTPSIVSHALSSELSLVTWVGRGAWLCG